MWNTGMLIYCSWGCKMLYSLWKTFLHFYKGQHYLTIQSSNYASKYLPKWIEVLCPGNNLRIYSRIIYKCPILEATEMFPLGEWINNLWYIYIMVCCSTIVRIGLSSHRKTWQELEGSLLSDRSQLGKAVWFQLYSTMEKAKLYR